MPFLFAITEVLFRLPVIGKLFRFAIPVANYVGVLPLDMQQRYRWALLDTFDMLSPAYDQPMTEQELRDSLPSTIGEIRRLQTAAHGGHVAVLANLLRDADRKPGGVGSQAHRTRQVTPIATALPNTGEYFWEYDPRSPRQIYLRLEVRDDAGNVAIDQLTEPIKVEGLEPKGQIRGFKPAGENNRGSFRSPLFR